MIIDGHCHAGEGDGFTGPWDTRACLDRYLERASAAKIRRTVVFAAFHSDYAAANRSVFELVRRSSGRLIGFVFVHSERQRGRIHDVVRKAVKLWEFRGIKLHRRDAPLTREVCESAKRFEIPILYDPTGEAHSIGLAAREYPSVPFIIPHLGSFADDWRTHESVIDLLVRYPNVFADTAGVRRFDYLQEAVERAGPSKVIFGSDGPFLHPGLELAKIRLLKLPPENEALIVGGNLRRLLRLEVAPEDVGTRSTSRCSRCARLARGNRCRTCSLEARSVG
jgi:predicted TIM-barrel fold metal-dependent hydrolase